MNEDTRPWYKRWGTAILAGLGLIVVGFAVAFTGRTKTSQKGVNKLQKQISGIDAEQTQAELREHKRLVSKLETEKATVQAENLEVHRKLAESPDYDPNKSDAENLDTLRSTKW
jgi:hypothetical protein